jgi:hypothetical protein
MPGLLVIYASALSFISGVCYTKRIYEEKEKAAANDRAKAEEIAKK